MAAPAELSPTECSNEDLARRIGTPGCPILIDVRIDADVDADPRLLPGALHHPHDRIEALAPGLKGQRVVVICHRGAKLSQGAAALLRLSGVRAAVLAGGHLGWAEAGLPLIPLAALPPRDAEGRTLWVTRQRPKVDRIACPWLIRRFLDRRARFLFVAPREVRDVADRFGATPFDIDGAEWGHHGDGCSFDAMVEGFDLATPALRRLAEMVRGADTGRPDLAPEAPGLLAFSRGLSHLYADDLVQLDAGMTVYDALYQWTLNDPAAGTTRRTTA